MFRFRSPWGRKRERNREPAPCPAWGETPLPPPVRAIALVPHRWWRVYRLQGPVGEAELVDGYPTVEAALDVARRLNRGAHVTGVVYAVDCAPALTVEPEPLFVEEE